MRLPHKTLEKKLLTDCNRIIAVDEVGMGALAGPVVVCAAMFDKKFFKKTHKKLCWLRDSKLLSAKQRETFAEKLFRVPGFKFQVCYCFPKTIDRLNIYQAARLAMRRAIKKLIYDSRLRRGFGGQVRFKIYESKTMVLVDGKTEIKGLGLPQLAIVKGDRKVFSIACASIIAKVYRDKMMGQYAKRFPAYGFDRHKGYGTALHLARLAQFGSCTIHRCSFTPVKFAVKLR